jgi:hypothetical protein
MTKLIKKKRVAQEHYVDNKVFFTAMRQYRREYVRNKKDGLPAPQVSNYIGDCIMKIAQRLSNSPNFMNYAFKDEMISDGIENCLQYIHNFNPNKSKNPFAYFTQIVYFAFLRRIEKERTHLYIKYSLIDNAMIDDFYQNTEAQNGTLAPINKYCSDHAQDYKDEFMKNFEAKKQLKKEKNNKRPSLNKLISK